MKSVRKEGIKSLLIRNLLRIPLINDHSIVTFFSAWSPSRKYGNFGAVYWNESAKSKIIFYVEELKSKPDNLEKHSPPLGYVKQVLDTNNILRHYKDGIGLITLIELEGKKNLNSFLKACVDSSSYLNEVIGEVYLNLIGAFPENFGNLNINFIFSFVYSFNNILGTSHSVNQLQISYVNEKNKRNTIVEILDFCKCEDIDINDIEIETNNYIKSRRVQMNYKNLQSIKDNFNRRVVLIHGSNRNGVKIARIWLKENIFNVKMGD